MKNTPQSVQSRNRNSRRFLVVSSAFLLCAAVAFSGCEEEMQDEAPPLNVPADLSNPELMRSVAQQIIRDGLADPSAMVRTHAIELVVETGQVRLIPAVQKLLGDEVVPVRFAAVLAIADLQYEFGKASVEAMLRDPDPNVKMAASYAMAKFGMTEYAAVLRKAIGSKDGTVRANAALLLGKLGNRDDLKLLYEALTDKTADDKVNYQAAESIARLGDERVHPSLWTMLISGYADVRLMGVLSMGMLKTDDAKEALVGMLDDEVLEVRVAAAGRLGALGDNVGEPVVLAAFEEGLLKGLNDRERERAAALVASAIGQIGTDALKNHLPELLQDPSKLVRIAAGGAVLQCIPGRN